MQCIFLLLTSHVQQCVKNLQEIQGTLTFSWLLDEERTWTVGFFCTGFNSAVTNWNRNLRKIVAQLQKNKNKKKGNKPNQRALNKPDSQNV